jgi:hypothetical protein
MMLQNNIRHLLVVDDDDKSNLNKPIGIITPLDFTRYQEYTNDEEMAVIQFTYLVYMVITSHAIYLKNWFLSGNDIDRIIQ